MQSRSAPLNKDAVHNDNKLHPLHLQRTADFLTIPSPLRCTAPAPAVLPHLADTTAAVPSPVTASRVAPTITFGKEGSLDSQLDSSISLTTQPADSPSISGLARKDSARSVAPAAATSPASAVPADFPHSHNLITSWHVTHNPYRSTSLQDYKRLRQTRPRLRTVSTPAHTPTPAHGVSE